MHCQREAGIFWGYWRILRILSNNVCWKSKGISLAFNEWHFFSGGSIANEDFKICRKVKLPLLALVDIILALIFDILFERHILERATSHDIIVGMHFYKCEKYTFKLLLSNVATAVVSHLISFKLCQKLLLQRTNRTKW